MRIIEFFSFEVYCIMFSSLEVCFEVERIRSILLLFNKFKFLWLVLVGWIKIVGIFVDVKEAVIFWEMFLFLLILEIISFFL